MSWVIDYSKHKGSAFVVLLMIANHAHADGTGSYAGLDTLAREARITPRQVINVIAILIRSGELSMKRGKGPRGTNLYTIHMRRGEKITGEKISPPEKISCENDGQPISPEPLGTVNLKTPLPPTDVGGEILYLQRYGETIEVQMGRRKRLPNLDSQSGARAADIARYLTSRGFPAQVKEFVQ